jgi:hypothetical protein
MAWYYFWQQTPETEWILGLADDRAHIAESKQPHFETALDLDNNFGDGDPDKRPMTSEELDAIRYRGDLYFDFDGESLDEVIPPFKRFLGKLHELGLNLAQCSIYASGGKGFHITVPVACFITKPNPRGYQFLPAIYKEIANDLYVNTLDFRVYSARRGRMWRTANVKRPNGMHKVPLTVQECRDMNPDLYREVCANPRKHFQKVEEPTYCSELGLMFSRALDKVTEASKNKKKSKADANLVKKWKGDAPPSMKLLMSGQHVAAELGFQKIAIQLSIFANAIGWKEDQLIEACEGLIENHQSDGNRYNSPKKRELELRRMYQYMADNPCYNFSVGGMRSLFEPEFKTPDLRLTEYEAGEDEEEDEDESTDWGVTLGMKVNATGIYKSVPEKGTVKCSALGLSNPVHLVTCRDGMSLGYEIDVFINGQPHGRRVLDVSTFSSKAKLQQFSLTMGASVQATDNQVGALADILRRKAEASNKKVFGTNREGVDVLTLPDRTQDIVWVAPEECVSASGREYRFLGDERGGRAIVNSDLMGAPDLTDNSDVRAFFRHLFNSNDGTLVARMFAWYCGAALRQIYHHYGGGQYPLLHIYGQAGSGKTQSAVLYNGMYSYQRTVARQSAALASQFAFRQFVSSSASIPIVIEEYKPREMDSKTLKFFHVLLRGAYNGDAMSQGTIDRSTGTGILKLTDQAITAPLVFVAEAQETESAIMERVITAPFSKLRSLLHEKDFLAAQDLQHVHRPLSSLGRLLSLAVVSQLDIAKFQEGLAESQKVAAEKLAATGADSRVIKNHAILLNNLSFARSVFRTVFGSFFDDEFERLSAEILNVTNTPRLRVQSELSKVVSKMAQLSRYEDETSQVRLIEGRDYVVHTDSVGAQTFVDIKVATAYSKYSRWCLMSGQTRLFDTEQAFIAALEAYGGTTDRVCDDNEILKDSPFTRVFRLSVAALSDDGSELFKTA